MNVEVAVLSSPSLTVLMVSVDVKSTLKNRAQELCESRGGRPELPVPNSPYGRCGRKATMNKRRRHSSLAIPINSVSVS